MKIPFRFIAGLLLMASLLAATSVRAEPEPAVQTLFQKLITILAKNDYEGFVAECMPTRKSVTTKAVFAELSQKVAPRAKGGYDAQFFGDYKQKGHAAYIWRLRFKDGGDDVMATLATTDGKCSLLFLH